MWRKSPLFLVLSLLTGTLSAQDGLPPACAASSCIQVGSFNVKYLGSQGRTQDELEALAALIWKDLDLEVLALQEIDTQSDAWAEVKRLLGEKGYEFMEGTTSGRNQFVVLAWDSDEVRRVPESTRELATDVDLERPGTPCHYGGLRRPVAGRFTAGSFDFWVIGVHLKSRSRGRWPNLLPSDCPAWIRKRQAEQLVEQVDSLVAASGVADVILVGDFNENLDDESLAPLRDAGFSSQMAYRMDGSGTTSYLPASDDDLIDHVWIRFAETREVVRNSGFVYVPPDKDAFERTMSDHAPVWASFRSDPEEEGEVGPGGAPSEVTISVISYNIEALTPPPPEWRSDLTTIQQRIRELSASRNPDVWGLSEVPDRPRDPGGTPWIQGLDEACDESGDCRYILGTTGRGDRLAILYRADRLELLDKDGNVVVPGEEGFDPQDFEVMSIYEASMGGGRRVGGRAPLAATFRVADTDVKFIFMVNHLHRSSKGKRRLQGTLLREWAQRQHLPVVAVGDYNFDWRVRGGERKHDKGYDNMTAGGIFHWVRPETLVKTHDSRHDSVLDFVFVSGEARNWNASSEIVVTPGDFPNDMRSSDHRPISATFEVP